MGEFDKDVAESVIRGKYQNRSNASKKWVRASPTVVLQLQIYQFFYLFQYLRCFTFYEVLLEPSPSSVPVHFLFHFSSSIF